MHFNCRVQPLELDSGIGGGELPVHRCGCVVALALGDGHVRFERIGVGNSVWQAPPQRAKFDLGHVHPTAVLGCIVNFQPCDQPRGFLRRKRVVQARGRVRVQIVHHQNHALNILIPFFEQAADKMGEVGAGAVISHFDLSPVCQRLKSNK